VFQQSRRPFLSSSWGSAIVSWTLIASAHR
jgi:hypothetical protein